MLNLESLLIQIICIAIMKVFKFIVLISFLIMSVGCGPNVTTIRGTKTAHHDLSGITDKNIYIADFTDKQGETLLFKKYKAALENYFFGYGYRVVDDIDESDLVAFISYGIGAPIVNTYSVPIYRYTSGRSDTSQSNVYSNQYGYIGYVTTTTHTMAKYEKVGTETKSYITYQRNFAMDILKVDAVLKKTPSKKVYEGRIKSIGRCNTVDAIMTELLQIMFKDFPGSGGTQDVDILSLTASNCSTN